ncbi:fimbrial protein [Pseudomonas fulva]|uniref:fimbrial protein n=1 Tax=Pseudomonas fulva TaxID=47880 RepID=UPI0018AA6FD0|nr:fimbrial protein [Pseudomonas fulva]MBF8777293.1 type 1 fimbrial protein [Pseudomonas fulva]
MKYLTVCAALVLSISSLPAMAATGNKDNRCWWYEKAPKGPMTFIRKLGTVHVPRDAQIGRQLGGFNVSEFTGNVSNSLLECFNGGSHWNFVFDTKRPLAPIYTTDGSPILETNIPGIGARIELGYPLNGETAAVFRPIGRNPPLVPFRAVHDVVNDTLFQLGYMDNNVTLYKTGPIAPGIHKIDTSMFTGHLDEPHIGLALTYYLQADVVNSECSLAGTGVSPNPVKLGEWERSRFSAPGITTPPEPFTITLSGCEVDPEHNTYATIELTGTNGSIPIGSPLEGVFSLTTASAARGVGIRVLKQDGTPLALNKEVPLRPLADGTTPLHFSAQFIQVEPATAVRAGDANGALNFTIRYR